MLSIKTQDNIATNKKALVKNGGAIIAPKTDAKNAK
jgi:hypothetical protein